MPPPLTDFLIKIFPHFQQLSPVHTAPGTHTAHPHTQTTPIHLNPPCTPPTTHQPQLQFYARSVLAQTNLEWSYLCKKTLSSGFQKGATSCFVQFISYSKEFKLFLPIRQKIGHIFAKNTLQGIPKRRNQLLCSIYLLGKDWPETLLKCLLIFSVSCSIWAWSSEHRSISWNQSFKN